MDAADQEESSAVGEGEAFDFLYFSVVLAKRDLRRPAPLPSTKITRHIDSEQGKQEIRKSKDIKQEGTHEIIRILFIKSQKASNKDIPIETHLKEGSSNSLVHINNYWRKNKERRITY